MLTCKELTELVTDHLEGRLPLGQRVRFQLHLGLCPRCRAHLRQMKVTLETLGRLPAEPVPADVRDELLARFRDLRPPGPVAVESRRNLVAVLDEWLRPRGWRVVAAILLGAGLLAVALGGEPGPLLGSWERCLQVELGAAALAVAAAALAAVRMRERLSAASLAAVAATGALLGFFHLQLHCPYSRVSHHVLAIGVGGILLAALLGAAASRLPALRPRLPRGSGL